MIIFYISYYDASDVFSFCTFCESSGFDFFTSIAKSVKEVILLSLDGTSTDYEKYKEIYSSDAAFQKAFEKGVKVFLTYRIILMSLVFLFPLQTLLLWWLPAKIGVLYTTLFFSYYPHIGTEIGRYKNTRFWQHWMPRYINHSMQLHFVHHLHPNIGHYDEPRAIEELKPFLIARGVPGAEEIPDRITYNHLIKIKLTAISSISNIRIEFEGIPGLPSSP